MLFSLGCNKCKPESLPVSLDFGLWCPAYNNTLTFQNDSGEVLTFDMSSTTNYEYDPNPNLECRNKYERKTSTLSLTNNNPSFYIKANIYNGVLQIDYGDIASWFCSAFYYEKGGFNQSDTFHIELYNYTIQGVMYSDVIKLKHCVTPYEFYWAKNYGLVYFGIPGQTNWWHRI